MVDLLFEIPELMLQLILVDDELEDVQLQGELASLRTLLRVFRG
jgi:hypothetical protein